MTTETTPFTSLLVVDTPLNSKRGKRRLADDRLSSDKLSKSAPSPAGESVTPKSAAVPPVKHVFSVGEYVRSTTHLFSGTGVIKWLYGTGQAWVVAGNKVFIARVECLIVTDAPAPAPVVEPVEEIKLLPRLSSAGQRALKRALARFNGVWIEEHGYIPLPSNGKPILLTPPGKPKGAAAIMIWESRLPGFVPPPLDVETQRRKDAYPVPDPRAPRESRFMNHPSFTRKGS